MPIFLSFIRLLHFVGEIVIILDLRVCWNLSICQGLNLLAASLAPSFNVIRFLHPGKRFCLLLRFSSRKFLESAAWGEILAPPSHTAASVARRIHGVFLQDVTGTSNLKRDSFVCGESGRYYQAIKGLLNSYHVVGYTCE